MTSNELPPPERRGIDPTDAQLAGVGDLDPSQPVVMLNLLRFREVADYSEHPDLKPAEPISGAAAYQLYGDAAQAHLAEIGATVDYFATCGPTVIGPPDEQWDVILLVRYPNPAAFLAMVNKPEYQALAGHRTAALADSRLVPTSG